MAEEVLELILSSQDQPGSFRPWFVDLFAGANAKCSLEEFGIFFFNFLRQQTEIFLRGNATPTCFTPRKISICETRVNPTPDLDDSLRIPATSTPTYRKKPVRTSLASEFNKSKGEDSFNTSFRSATSTPIRSFNKSENNHTMDSNSSYDKSRSRNFSLGDCMVICTRGSKKKADTSGSSKTPKLEQNKPKKRVAPLTLSRSTGEGFTSPAFRNENNLLQIKDSDIMQTEPKSRFALKSEITEIRKQIEDLPPKFLQQNLRASLEDKLPPSKTTTIIDLSKVTHKSHLKRFACIYSCLIDLNIATNILTELSFVLNILNVEEEVTTVGEIVQRVQSIEMDIVEDKLINKTNQELYSLFKTIPNCIFFALEVLNLQRSLLAMLDLVTLKVIVDNRRMAELDNGLQTYLLSVFNGKSRRNANKSELETSFPVGNSFSSVFFQQENDSRDNFSNDNEFAIFKRQRDLFYSALKSWESNHLNHTNNNFDTDQRYKIGSIFKMSEHPINMAHLSRLFVSQLIISSNFSESPTGLGNIDAQKLNKLQQRFVEPSNFSTNYQFPGSQLFFKDFLLNAKSVVFVEQVKIALIAELVQLNNSTFDILCLGSNEAGEEYQVEYAVRPEVMTTMKILAKFVGLVVSMPFAYESNRRALSDKKQLELRNIIQPCFDVLDLLRKAMAERKLLLTIPWLVQYVAMLETVTLQLTYYKQLTKLFYELYRNLKSEYVPEVLKLRPTSVFIIQTCLGWLFDQVGIAGDYYAHRQSRMIAMEADQSLSCIANTNKEDSFSDPLLEGMMNVYCPFLADFRVAIMPTKVSKCVSRSGRYRHITTKMPESPKKEIADKEPKSRTKLIDAFLHAQSLSVRRIIEFVIERTSSAVIKDFQMEHLLPSKTEAQDNIRKIQQTEFKAIRNEIRGIYQKVFNEIMVKWELQVPKMIEERAKKALDAMLPNETLPVVRATCLRLIAEKCATKTEEWRLANLKGIEFYSKSLNDDVESFNSSSKKSANCQSTALEILRDDVSVADLLDEMQYFLYYTLFRPELVVASDLHAFLAILHHSLDGNILPTLYYRIVGSKSIDLIQNLIQNHPTLVTDRILDQFGSIWLHDCMHELTGINEGPDKLNIFDGLITVAFIRALNPSEACYAKLADLLIKLVSLNLLTIDYLNTQFLNLYKVELGDDCLKAISKLLDKVVMTSADLVPSIISTNDGKSQLFMEMLADLSRNVDEF